MNLKDKIINILGRPKNRRFRLVENQGTDDIIEEISTAHEFFKNDYDKFSHLFYNADNKKILQNLFDFCKANIPYVVETGKLQTTRSPSVILHSKGADCKHYAGFIAGVLDSINRKFNKKIRWAYRFAGYKDFSENLQHVFVVVKTPTGEIWVDPCFNSLDDRSSYPVVYHDISIKNHSAAIGALERIGLTPIDVEEEVTDFLPEADDHAGSGPLPPAKKYLTDEEIKNLDVPEYEKYVIKKGIELQKRGLNYYIEIMEHFGRPVYYDVLKDPPFVFGYYDGNNFHVVELPPETAYYGQPCPPPIEGLTVIYNQKIYGYTIPEGMPAPIIRNGKLVFDKLYFPGTGEEGTKKMMGENGAFLMVVMAAAMGAMQLAFSPYPDAYDFENMLNFRVRHNRNHENFLKQHNREPKTFVGKILKEIGKGIESIGQGAVKLFGAVPRQAFRLVVASNFANLAVALDKKMQQNQSELEKWWDKWGGEWKKLKQSIEAGSDEKPWYLGLNQLKGLEALAKTDPKEWDKIDIEDGEYIGADPATGTATVLTALPIIVSVIKIIAIFLPDGKAKELADVGSEIYDKIANEKDPNILSELANWLDANFKTKVPANDGSNGQAPYPGGEITWGTPGGEEKAFLLGNKNLLIIAAAGAAGLLLLNKK